MQMPNATTNIEGKKKQPLTFTWRSAALHVLRVPDSASAAGAALPVVIARLLAAARQRRSVVVVAAALLLLLLLPLGGSGRLLSGQRGARLVLLLGGGGCRFGGRLAGDLRLAGNRRAGRIAGIVIEAEQGVPVAGADAVRGVHLDGGGGGVVGWWRRGGGVGGAARASGECGVRFVCR